MPGGLWEKTLTFVCRSLIAIALADWLNHVSRTFSVRHLGGFGLRPAELEDLRDHGEDDDIRRQAQGSPEIAGRRGSDQRINWNPLAGMPARQVRKSVGTAVALLVSAGVLANWSWPAKVLAVLRGRAGSSRRRFRDDHARAAWELTERRRRRPSWPIWMICRTGSNDAAIAALSRLGPEAYPVLGDVLLGVDTELARRAAPGLSCQGVRAAPTLALGLASSDAAVRRLARIGILRVAPPLSRPWHRTRNASPA